MRVHHSFLLQLDAIVRVERTDGSASRLFVRGRTEPVPVSRALTASLKATLAGR